MSIELSLLKAFCDKRDVEVQYHGYIDTLDNMEREVQMLFNLVRLYYKEFDHDSIEKADLLAFYELKHPRARARDLHLELINQVYVSTMSEDLLKGHLDQLIEKYHATQMVNKLLPVMEGDSYGVLDTIRTDIDRYTDLLHNPPAGLTVPEPCELSVEELVQQEIMDGGLPWHLPGLTDIIGGLRKNTLGLIYAFVDSGKTSFTMAACANFAAQLADTEDVIAYCGNEESSARLRLRLVQAITNWNRKQIRENQQEANNIANLGGLKNVKIFDGITTDAQLEHVVKNYHPHILFIDQAPAIEIKQKRHQEGVAYLESLFRYYRNLASLYDCGIIGVAQAVGEAEDTKYLKLSDIYGARVVIQAALDWACGIGRKVNNKIDDDLRYLNIPKNKLHDGDGGRMTVMFDKYLCQYQEV